MASEGLKWGRLAGSVKKTAELPQHRLQEGTDPSEVTPYKEAAVSGRVGPPAICRFCSTSRDVCADLGQAEAVAPGGDCRTSVSPDPRARRQFEE